jgi:hypothetical protein
VGGFGGVTTGGSGVGFGVGGGGAGGLGVVLFCIIDPVLLRI